VEIDDDGVAGWCKSEGGIELLERKKRMKRRVEIDR